MTPITDADQGTVNTAQQRYNTPVPKRPPKAYDGYMANLLASVNFRSAIGSKKGMVVASGPYKGLTKGELESAALDKWTKNPEVRKPWEGIASGSLDTPVDKANEEKYKKDVAAAFNGGTAPASPAQSSTLPAPASSSTAGLPAPSPVYSPSASAPPSAQSSANPQDASGASFASNGSTAPMQMRTEAERQARITESNSRNAAIPISSKQSGTLPAPAGVPVKRMDDGRLSAAIPAQYGGGMAYGGTATAMPAPASTPGAGKPPTTEPTNTKPTVMPPPASVTSTGGSWGAPSPVSANPNPPTVMPPPSSVASATPTPEEEARKRREAAKQKTPTSATRATS